MSTFTTTKQLEQVARGADVGVWDTPTNSNWAVVDAALAQVTTISLNNTPVTLNAAQFQCSQIVFNSTLTGSVAITFPTSFTGPYMIQNNCTGSSAFVITLQTTAASSGLIVGCPFGEMFDVFNDGTNIRFRNLGRVGAYEDWMCSSMPAWVSACTVPPYLNCDGTSFSSALYPTLAVRLSGNVLPDSRSKVRIPLAGSATVISSAITGLAVNTLAATGGDQNTQSHTHVSSVVDPGHVHTTNFRTANNAIAASPGGTPDILAGTVSNPSVNSAVTGITVTTMSYGSGGAQNIQPSYIGGITVVRAG